MDKLKKTKKITLATLKAFARRNNGKLFSKETSNFCGHSGATDNVQEENLKFKSTEITDNTGYYQTGIQGIYTVGCSDDSFEIYEDEDFFGIKVYNCCGGSVLAIKKPYETYTSKVKKKIDSIKKYPLVNLEINVDGTACLLVKYSDKKYYEEKLTKDKMSMKADVLAQHIINCVESYFIGWAEKRD